MGNRMKADEVIKEWNKRIGGDKPDIISYDLISLVDFALKKQTKRILNELEKVSEYGQFAFIIGGKTARDFIDEIIKKYKL